MAGVSCPTAPALRRGAPRLSRNLRRGVGVLAALGLAGIAFGQTAFPPVTGPGLAGGAPAGDAQGLGAGTGPSGRPPMGSFVEASIKAQETYTTNANFGAGSMAQGDWVSELVPMLVAREVGKRFQLDAAVSVDAIDYLHDTEPARVLPRGSVDGTLEAIPDHLFVDAGATATQLANNVLAPSSQTVSSYNTYTVMNYHVAPDLRGALPMGLRYELRSDNSWTRASGAEADLTDIYSNSDLADLTLQPRPLGAELRLQQFAADYQGDPNAPPTREQSGRLWLRLQVNPYLVVGLDGGRERENFVLGNQESWIRGAQFDWRPSDRSEVSTSVERRYFGTGFNYAATHRNPWCALSLTGSRDVLSSPQQLFSLPATGDVPALLEQMLATEYPDPVTRAQAVQNLMTSQNLPVALGGPVTLFTPAALLVEQQQASVAFSGVRSSVVLALFATRTEPVPLSAESALAPATLATQYSQHGFSLSATHKVTAPTSLGADFRESHINGNGSATLSSGFERQDSLTLRADHSMSARTNVQLGARYQYFNSSTVGAVREAAVFAALTHRF